MSEQRFQSTPATTEEWEALGPVVRLVSNEGGSSYRHESDLWRHDADGSITVHRGYFVTQLTHAERELISRLLRASYEPIASRYDGLTPNERALCDREEFDWLVAWLGSNSK